MRPCKIYKIVVKRNSWRSQEKVFHTLDDRMIDKVRNALQRAEKQLQEKGVKQAKYTEFFIDSHKEPGELDFQQHHESTVAFLQGLLKITEKETWSFRIFAVPVPDWGVVSAALNKIFNDGVPKK